MVGTAQLLALGLDSKTITRLVRRGFLVRLHPGVYAVGYRRRGIEPRLQSGLLLGGESSALSHRAGAFWLRLVDRAPRVIELRVDGRRRSRPGIRFHRSPGLLRVRFRGLWTTTPAGTLVDLGSRTSPRELRRAIATADRLGMLDLDSIRGELRRGRAGSAALRAALADHRPEFAVTLSELEDRFLELLERVGLELPEVNARVDGMMVDALFRDARLVVELDGHRFHADPAASEEDRRRELRLRRLGFRVVRYTWRQVTQTPDEVVADLRRELGHISSSGR